jgi:hypothetical protein
MSMLMELNSWWALQVHPKGASRVVLLGKLALQNLQDLQAGRWPEWVTVGFYASQANAHEGLKEVRKILKKIEGAGSADSHSLADAEGGGE